MGRSGALGFGEIAASYSETIVRQVRYRPRSIDKPYSAIPGLVPSPPLCASSPQLATVRSPRTELRDFPLRATSGSPGLHGQLAVP